MRTLALALLSIAMAVLAQFLLRRGMGQAVTQADSGIALWRATAGSPWVAGGLVLYVGSALIWLGVLARWEVSKAYPLVGLGFVLTLAAGWALGEEIGSARVVGVILIAAGVALVSAS